MTKATRLKIFRGGWFFGCALLVCSAAGLSGAPMAAPPQAHVFRDTLTHGLGHHRAKPAFTGCYDRDELPRGFR